LSSQAFTFFRVLPFFKLRLEFVNAQRVPHRSSNETLERILRKVAESQLHVDVLDSTFGVAECPSATNEDIVYKIQLTTMHCTCPTRALGFVCEHLRITAEQSGGLLR